MITARWVGEALGRCVGCPPYQEMIPGGFGGITGMDLMHALGITSRRLSHVGGTLVRRRYLGAPENPALSLVRALHGHYPGLDEQETRRKVTDALRDWERPDTCTTCNGGLSNCLAILKDQQCPECQGSGYRTIDIEDEPTRWLILQMRTWEWEVLGMMARLLREEFEDEWERANMGEG